MDFVNFNKILERETIQDDIRKFLEYFENNKNDLSIKRGIYIYGDPGSGKTTFIKNILTNMNYDIIQYDAGDIRNKSIIDTIAHHNMSNINVLSLLKREKKRIAIIMDEIDGMNNGDKGGINSLIKIIRPKKTKKQKLEDISYIPIICISNYHIDKKIKELIKVSTSFELKSPTDAQMKKILLNVIPAISKLSNNIIPDIIKFIQNDLRKLIIIIKLYKNNPSIIQSDTFIEIFQPKLFSENTKNIAKNLINHQYNINEHNILMNETDRTIIGLLWHENIIETLIKLPKKQTISIYLKLLELPLLTLVLYLLGIEQV